MQRSTHALPLHSSRLFSVFLSLTLFFGSATAPADPTAAPGEKNTGPEGCDCVGRVGNVNCDYLDEVTLADITLLIDHLFISGARLPSPQEANASGDPEGVISLCDVSALIDHLFITRQELPWCPKPYNNPPNTYIHGLVAGIPFINAVAPGNSATGVRLRWGATDLVDHPYDNPSFAFEYRIYGPYTDAEHSWIDDHLIREVFRTDDGHMFFRGAGAQYVLCDTTWLPGGVQQLLCDTVLLDTIESEVSFGRLDTLLDIDDPAFAVYDRIAASSGDGTDTWTTDLADSAYNLFANQPSDTTVRANFYVWVRARDPLDPEVIDPTPAFQRVEIIEPKHERDLLVIDWGVNAFENAALRTPNRNFWSAAAQHWILNGNHNGSAEFSPAVDWRHIDTYQETQTTRKPTLLLTDVLRHKLVIVVQDVPMAGLWSSQGLEVRDGIMTAMATGVNAWVVARVPFGNAGLQSPFAQYNGSVNYQYFFGAAQYIFPGWGSHLYTNSSSYGLPRTEDFVEAYSEDALRWPNLAIDTALLRACYKWEGCVPSPDCYSDPDCNPSNCFPYIPFVDDDFPFLGAIPQVGWVLPTPDAEVMYTFKSLYGAVHPIDPALSFEGLPARSYWSIRS
jgi:hypothetical protein